MRLTFGTAQFLAGVGAAIAVTLAPAAARRHDRLGDLHTRRHPAPDLAHSAHRHAGSTRAGSSASSTGTRAAAGAVGSGDAPRATPA